MSASTTTETRTTAQNRNRRGKGGRGRGGHANKAARRSTDNKPAPTTDEPTPSQASKAPTTITVSANDTPANTAPNDDPPVCWICAEPVKYYSLSACNHRTCHVCALRLRALYKKLDCTFCKVRPFLSSISLARDARSRLNLQEPQSTVIFTTSPDADFASYTADAIPYKDHKLAIFFETQDMHEETLILLRFNCPDPECDYHAAGWGDLKLHTRAVHGKVLW